MIPFAKGHRLSNNSSCVHELFFSVASSRVDIALSASHNKQAFMCGAVPPCLLVGRDFSNVALSPIEVSGTLKQ
jgi:hypothetical protein